MSNRILPFGKQGNARPAFGAAALLAALAVGGCHLYDAGKDKLAQLAQSSLGDAKIAASLDDERDLAKQLNAAEQAAIRREVEANRDEALARILEAQWTGASSLPANTCASQPAPDPKKAAAKPCVVAWSAGGQGSLLCDVDDRIDRVVSGGSAKLASDLLDANRAVRNAEQEMAASDRRARHERKVPLLSCPETGPLKDPAALSNDPNVQGYIRLYQATCTRYRDAKTALATQVHLAATSSGLFASVERQRRLLADSLQKQSEAATKLAKDYADAKQAYDDAVKSASATKDQLAAVSAKLLAIQAEAQRVEAALPAGNIFARVEELQARYDAVVEVIKNLNEGKPAASSPIQLVLATAVDLKTIEDERRLPALLLEAERLRGELDAAKLRVAHQQRELELLSARSEALLAEARELLQAHNEIIQATCAKCVDGNSVVADAWKSGTPECQLGLARALSHYGASWSVGETRQRLAGAAVRAERHLAAIDLSQAAMQAWQSVLAVPMGLVVKYHAGGIKPEALAGFITAVVQAAGFADIAATN